MKNWIQRQGADALVVLAFDGGNLHATVVRKGPEGGFPSGTDGISARLSLPIHSEGGDPEVLGLELRQQLEKAGIRERACVVGLPQDWVFTRLTPLPELSEEDRQSLLDLDAERGFPFSLDELMVARCRFTSGGQSHALQLAVARERVERLEIILRRAKLDPLSFSVAGLAWNAVGSQRPPGGVRLWLLSDTAVLMVNAGNGLAGFRDLGSQARIEGDSPGWDAAILAREVRVTLGQLSPGLRADVRHFAVLGNEVEARALSESLISPMAACGLAPEVTGSVPGCWPLTVARLSQSLAARYWDGRGDKVEFLPPRISAWQQLTARYSNRKLAYVGGAVGALATILLLAMAFQQYRLHSLSSRWAAMSDRVRELEEIEQNIRRFRPWYDNSVQTLRIMRGVTEAFPEDSSVTAKTLEIHDNGQISCSGTARDQQSVFRVMDALRSNREVANVQIDHFQGNSPLRFTLNIRWEGAAQP